MAVKAVGHRMSTSAVALTEHITFMHMQVMAKSTLCTPMAAVGPDYLYYTGSPGVAYCASAAAADRISMLPILNPTSAGHSESAS